MLIRVDGGNAGIKEYLEEGIKNGRDYTRDELDHRAILDGELDLTNKIILGMESKGQRYLHITLAFKEDHIDNDTLKAITQDFKAFAFKAYDDDEYNFYAEAHLPKIKSYVDKSTGESIERKPHIHVVIPQVNLKTNNRLMPFGYEKNNLEYVDAFQEVINEKYGLASPKIHVRDSFTDESTLISRYKGDLFKSTHREIKTKLLNDLIDKNITTKEQFITHLEQSGYKVTLRNKDKVNEYINIKKGSDKGINLKEAVFNPTFIMQSKQDKSIALKNTINTYIDKGSGYKANTVHSENLTHWNKTRAYEMRYIKYRNRDEYNSLSKDKQQQFLKEKINNGNERISEPSITDIKRTVRSNSENIRTAGKYLSNAERNSSSIESGVRNVTHRRVIRAVTAHINKHNSDKNAIRESEPTRPISNYLDYSKSLHPTLLPDINSIKKQTTAVSLLTALSISHGLNPKKYIITTSPDGTDKIQCGKRQLNTADFLTKEMTFSWKEAKHYLEDNYLKQRGINLAIEVTTQHNIEPNVIQAAWRNQLQSEKATRKEHLKNYQIEKKAIYSDETLTKEERQVVLSITRMNKVIFDMNFKEETKNTRSHLNTLSSIKQDIDMSTSGTVINHGADNYLHDKDKSMSYFMTVEKDGIQKTTWGKGLELAIKENNIKIGDYVSLEKSGQKDVSVKDEVIDEKGNKKSETIEAVRNEWVISKTDKPTQALTNNELTQSSVNELSAIKMLRANPEYNQNNELKNNAQGSYNKIINNITELVKRNENNPFNESQKTLHNKFNELKNVSLDKEKTEAIKTTNKDNMASHVVNNTNKEKPITLKLLDKELEASRLLIHYPKLKELGVNAKSITKTDNGDKIEYGNKKLSVTKLIKETHNLDTKEVIAKLSPIYKTQLKDKERVDNYKKENVKNKAPIVNSHNTQENIITSSNNNIELIKVNESIKANEPLKANEPYNFGKDITHKTNEKGHVSYFMNNEKMITDRGKDVLINNDTSKAVEMGLRLSIEKFGNHIDVKGTPEYKEQIIDIAAKNNIKVQFVDKQMNEQLLARKEQYQKGENIISSAEIAYKSNNQQPEKPQVQAQVIDQNKGKGWSR